MESISKFVEKLLPNAPQRRLYLEILSEIIVCANSFGSQKWGIVCRENSIR